MPNPKILILAPLQDPHAAAVHWALQQNGVEALWAPSLRSSDRAEFSLWVSPDEIHLESPDYSRHDLRSAWHRRPTLPDAGTCQEADRDFIAKQWKSFQKNVFDQTNELSDALWVNAPTAAVRAENKLAQLQAARACSLAFPETVIGNRADDVRRLIQRCGKVVFKSFYPHSWQSTASGEITHAGVVLLEEGSALPADAIAMCPGIYQRYVDKAFDVRVTVIGEQFFAVKLLQQSGSAYLDWRPHSLDSELRMEAFALPQALQDKLRRLMKRLDLVFGCIDLVVDHAGEAFFLEVNQAGQFLFVEERLPELALLRAMTAMLLTGRTDYALNDSVAVSFADYLGSDACRQNDQLARELQRRSGLLHSAEA